MVINIVMLFCKELRHSHLNIVVVSTVFMRYATFSSSAIHFLCDSISLADSNSREGKGSVGGAVGGVISSLIVVSLIVLVVISGLWWWRKR